MKATADPLLAIFDKKLRLEVPLFQRQYVWGEDKHWAPLWEDISRKFSEHLEGRTDGPVHFLGAMVFDQKQTPTTAVERRQVIDGQQRLTTLQIFLAVFRDFALEQGCTELAKECERFTANEGMMSDKEADQFKVWPTQLDRGQFKDVMKAGSRKALEKLHPERKKKYARKPEPRPRMVEAYIYFDDRLYDFFIGHDDDPALLNETPIATRLETCFGAMRTALQVVVVDLEKEDDAQVIFETLNARGEPLLPADLLRNFIFLRAARLGEPQEELYEKYWQKFDDDFWRQEVSQGRNYRPRSDLFLQHMLASRRATDIPIKHLFVEYKYWIDRSVPKPFNSVREELQALEEQGNDFRRMIDPVEDDTLYDFYCFLADFEVSPVYPLLLALSRSGLSDTAWLEIAQTIESYLLRRAVCGLTTKNYNRTFLNLVRQLQGKTGNPEVVRNYFTSLTGESVVWPSDTQFSEAWLNTDAYHSLSNAKLARIFLRLNQTYVSRKSEPIRIAGALTIEHLMPQNWVEHWPLPDGTQGLPWSELAEMELSDPMAAASLHRRSMLQTIGNLTLITGSLNTAVSNGPWSEKRGGILRSSLLPLNQQLHDMATWDEEAILKRGKELLARCKKLWPGPIEITKAQQTATIE